MSSTPIYVDQDPRVRKPTYVDQGTQVGEPWAEELVKEAYNEDLTRDRRFDRLLLRMRRGGWSLGKFLEKLFTTPGPNDLPRSRRHAQTVSAFLGSSIGPGGGYQMVKADRIAELMYANKDSAPKAVRSKPGTANVQRDRPDGSQMARGLLREWATRKVEGYVGAAANEVSGKDGGFHLTPEQTTWDFIHGFSIAKAVLPVEKKGAVIFRMLAAAALPAALREAFRPSPEKPNPYFTHLSRPVHAGSGGNRKDPIVIIVITFLMLMYARNLHFSVFRKIAGIWLFANNASSSIFSILSRIGFSSSYTTVLKTLRTLSASAQSVVRLKARLRAFLLIYDNINRMHRAWDPDLGQRDRMDSGTAATFIELMNCDVAKAFDPIPLKAARDKNVRKQLTTEVLLSRIDMAQLNGLMALHSLSFLVAETPALVSQKPYINLRFRTTHAKHRMPDASFTAAFPLATSDKDEGSTAGNRDVLDDLLLRQLGMDKADIDKLLIIVGGDQSTVEKIRTLQNLIGDCSHGYSSYSWVLPLIQLWHMGWADLERILSTHWGRTASNSETGDMSSFYFVNTILKRKIKDVKRPDYYPTQNFVFDTLKVEILDCWRVHLGTPDLNAYFEANPLEIEDLLKLASEIADLYLSTDASEKARAGYEHHQFKMGDPWPRSSAEDAMDVDDKRPLGDVVLANVILRLRDSMLHYEFQHAISDGDIGRAMNVMAVWTFTFTGCGKNKYSNELLELACNFQYEYSSDLQKAVLNNWLCRFNARSCWFPMDLLQEKNIRLLKKMSERKDASFGASFYQDIVSYNIRAFTKATETMKAAVGIGRTGGKHKRAKKAAAMKELATAISERQLHRFRAGRDFGYNASDDFETGYIKLSSGKVKNFIKRTIADAGNLHGDQDGIDEEEQSHPARLPFPNVVIDGILHCGGDSDSEESSGSESE
ncbi:hypothetical protein B0H15DRAFT_803715 [Mycena belliarum]|uniref:DUF6589 domain-containing protein n=1 Tax=Mycena belliarum TaxID=1033014 RepID=A0AAD6XMG3_9AGAR|nr:hypothetical protein B0H15DRAFT_803715 [Mycena belliae]